MEINQMRYFLEVASTQHVTRSAERLHIAQPALSKAIHNLEQELGVPLFASKGRNIVLTEYGKYLQEKMSGIISEIDDLPQELKSMADRENATIHLKVLAASTLITDAIIEYRRKHPKINFQLMQNDQSKIYDISVTTERVKSEEIFNSENRFELIEKIFLAVPAEHRLAKREKINLTEVEKDGFISLMGSKQLRWICDKFCRQAGFEPRIIFESDNPAAVKNMVCSNMGICFWPEFSWGNLQKGSAVLLEIEQPLCERENIFKCRENKLDNRAVRDFFEFLQEFFDRKAHKRRNKSESGDKNNIDGHSR